MQALLSFFGIVAFIAFFGFIIWIGQKQAEEWRNALRGVANEYGLQFSAGSWMQKSAASGTIGKLFLKVDSYTVSTGKSSQTYTRIELTGLPTGIQLERHGMGAAFKNLFLGDGEKLGDGGFDEKVVVRGAPLVVSPLLAQRTRQAALDCIVGHGVSLKDGKLRFVRGGLIRDQQKLSNICRSMLALAAEIDDGLPIPQRLANVVTQERRRQPRRQALELLAHHFPNATEAQAAFRAGLADPHPAIRLVAAGALGEVEGIIDVVADRNATDEVRHDALEQLERARVQLSEDQLRRADQALNGVMGRAGLRALAMQVRVRHRILMPLDKLDRAIELGNEETRSAAAELLGHYRGQNVEPTLIRLLDGNQPGPATVAARTLATVGSAAAVEPLMGLTKGLFLDGELKSTARNAIIEIQGRLGSARPGGLSVLDDPGHGALSMDRAQAGALSAAERQPHPAAQLTRVPEPTRNAPPMTARLQKADS